MDWCQCGVLREGDKASLDLETEWGARMTGVGPSNAATDRSERGRAIPSSTAFRCVRSWPEALIQF